MQKLIPPGSPLAPDACIPSAVVLSILYPGRMVRVEFIDCVKIAALGPLGLFASFGVEALTLQYLLSYTGMAGSFRLTRCQVDAGTAQSLVGIFGKASLINHETKTTNIVSRRRSAAARPRDRHGKNENN